MLSFSRELAVPGYLLKPPRNRPPFPSSNVPVAPLISLCPGEFFHASTKSSPIWMIVVLSGVFCARRAEHDMSSQHYCYHLIRVYTDFPARHDALDGCSNTLMDYAPTLDGLPDSLHDTCGSHFRSGIIHDICVYIGRFKISFGVIFYKLEGLSNNCSVLKMRAPLRSGGKDKHNHMFLVLG